MHSHKSKIKPIGFSGIEITLHHLQNRFWKLGNLVEVIRGLLRIIFSVFPVWLHSLKRMWEWVEKDNSKFDKIYCLS